jgi:DUF1680 family protein
VLVGRPRAATDALYTEYTPQAYTNVETQLVPYFYWSNRGVSEMTVWLPVDRK